MAFLKSKQRPIYLHFLDRELRRAEGANYSDDSVLEFLIAAILNSLTYCYSSASLLQESKKVIPQTTTALLELEKMGFVKLLTNEHSFNEFIQSRREIYAHKESRYPMYFGDADEKLWPANPEIITSSTTANLRSTILEWIDNSESTHKINKGQFDTNTLKEFTNKLLQERDKAITLDLFLGPEQLKVDQIRRSSGRMISYFYSKRYLDLFDGDVLCNLPYLSFYDRLSSNPAVNDFRVLQVILRRCLIPIYFYTQGVFKIEKLISFLNSPSFRFLQVELLAITKALVESAAEKRESVTEALKLFISNFNTQIVKIEAQPSDFLHQVYLSLSSSTLSISKLNASFYKFYEVAKHELTTVNRTLIVTATAIEARTFIKSMASVGHFPTTVPLDKLIFWNFGTIGNSEILMVKLGDMGSSKTSGSTLVVKDAIDALNPTYAIMLGIAFGLKSEQQQIGTILVSRELEDYDSAKAAPDTIIPRGHRIPAGPTLLSRFDSSSITYEKCPIDVGLVLSGNKLVDNEDVVKQLKKSFPEARGGEMEGTGLQATSHREKVEWIVVKGICDWGYNKQGEDKDKNQELAISNVCDYFIYTLKHYPF
jgi:nucleoside phosphorylase